MRFQDKFPPLLFTDGELSSKILNCTTVQTCCLAVRAVAYLGLLIAVRLSPGTLSPCGGWRRLFLIGEVVGYVGSVRGKWVTCVTPATGTHFVSCVRGTLGDLGTTARIVYEDLNKLVLWSSAQQSVPFCFTTQHNQQECKHDA